MAEKHLFNNETIESGVDQIYNIVLSIENNISDSISDYPLLEENVLKSLMIFKCEYEEMKRHR